MAPGATNSIDGTWGVRGGCIVPVMTNITAPIPARLYKLSRYRILEIDSRKMVYKLEGGEDPSKTRSDIITQFRK
jgi:hypothetical protein